MMSGWEVGVLVIEGIAAHVEGRFVGHVET